MKREVVPEYLDALPADDPRARRSRADLARINTIMGNFRWMHRSLDQWARRRGKGRVVEAGAGDGRLAASLANQGWEVMAIDLAPPPPRCPSAVRWVQDDLASALSSAAEWAAEGRGDSVLIANLFWHHFPDDRLAAFGRDVGAFAGVFAGEPWRARRAMALGWGLVPMINEITRHDMFVSIRAGFVPGELPGLWELSEGNWALEETVTVRGAYRLQAWQHGK